MIETKTNTLSNTVVYDLYITPKKARVADTLRFCQILGLLANHLIVLLI